MTSSKHPLRAALYARVSTNRQALFQSIDQQIDRLREYVVSQGWPLSEEYVFRRDNTPLAAPVSGCYKG